MVFVASFFVFNSVNFKPFVVYTYNVPHILLNKYKHMDILLRHNIGDESYFIACYRFFPPVFFFYFSSPSSHRHKCTIKENIIFFFYVYMLVFLCGYKISNVMTFPIVRIFQRFIYRIWVYITSTCV